MDPRFAHIRDWIFDLDNCLYPASTGLFELIDERMGAYIERLLGCDAAEAQRVQKTHFHGHGTTLAGLMKQHDVDPHHFLERRPRHPARPGPCATTGSARLLPRLPGRKFVFTNGDAHYARRVLDRSASRPFRPPPRHLRQRPQAQARPARLPHAVRPVRDRPEPRADGRRHGRSNLAPAKALGMTTVWVDNGSERGNHGYDEAIVDHRITNVGEWLESILGDERMNERCRRSIEHAWEERDSVGPDTKGEVRQAVDAALAALDSGEARIAEKPDGEWMVHQWLKKAVLLSFRLNPMEPISGGPGGAHLVGQGAVQVRRLGREGVRSRRFPRGARARSSAAAPISRPARC